MRKAGSAWLRCFTPAQRRLRIVTALAHPVMPESTAKIWAQIGLGDIKKFDLTQLRWGQLHLGTKLGEVQAVFPRADKSAVERMQKMEEQGASVGTSDSPVQPTEARQPVASTNATGQAGSVDCTKPAATIPDGKISIDDFAKVELRVAQVKTAERVKGADKLLRLEVDLGTEVRQFVAGIAEAYEPETLIGRKVVDRGQPRSAQTARAGIEWHDRRGIARRREAGAGELSGGCADGDEVEVETRLAASPPISKMTYAGRRGIARRSKPRLYENLWQTGKLPVFPQACSSTPTHISKANATTPIATRCWPGRDRTGSKPISQSAMVMDPKLPTAASGWRRRTVTTCEYPEIWASVGIHPHEASLANDAADSQLLEWARHRKVIAWGEIGLDYFYDHSPGEIQKAVFRRQMELAQTAKLPIIIHCRPSENSENAWDDCLALITEQWVPSGLGGVLHCFTGSIDYARRALDVGFMISFAGNITFPKAQNIRDAAQFVPLDRMLIETDSPYLAPIPHRGQRNEPAFVIEVARQIGQLRGLTTEAIGEQTAENFRRFFRPGQR